MPLMKLTSFELAVPDTVASDIKRPSIDAGPVHGKVGWLLLKLYSCPVGSRIVST